MENINYIPVGQVNKIRYKTSKLKRIIKKNKLLITVGISSAILLIIYVNLMVSFARLICSISNM